MERVRNQMNQMQNSVKQDNELINKVNLSLEKDR